MGSPHEPTRTPLAETVERKRSLSFPSKRDLWLLGSRAAATLRPLATPGSRTVAEDTPDSTCPQAGSRSPASDPGASRQRRSRDSHHAGRSGARPPPRVRRSHISRSFSLFPHRLSQEFLLAGGPGHRPPHLPLDFVRHSGSRSPALPSSLPLRCPCYPRALGAREVLGWPWAGNTLSRENELEWFSRINESAKPGGEPQSSITKLPWATVPHPLSGRGAPNPFRGTQGPAVRLSKITDDCKSRTFQVTYT